MADNKYIRVFVTDARLSYPALDAPREDLNGEPRYQAPFLLEPSNPCLAKIREAIRQVATAMFGQSAAVVMRSPDGIPRRLRRHALSESQEQICAGIARC